MKPDVIDNDHLDKANMSPPQDPESEQTMIPDLIMTKVQILTILESSLLLVQEWLLEQKAIYNT